MVLAVSVGEAAVTVEAFEGGSVVVCSVVVVVVVEVVAVGACAVVVPPVRVMLGSSPSPKA
jgi:hypothetical protein